MNINLIEEQIFKLDGISQSKEIVNIDINEEQNFNF